MIDEDKFYELAELIVLDVEDDVILKCPQTVQNGRKYYWGLDLLAAMGNESAQMELKRITKTIHKGK